MINYPVRINIEKSNLGDVYVEAKDGSYELKVFMTDGGIDYSVVSGPMTDFQINEAIEFAHIHGWIA